MWRNKIADIAAQHKELTFAIADEDQMKEMFREFGFDESGEEMNVGILDDKGRKFPMEPMDSFDRDEVESFIKKYSKGEFDLSNCWLSARLQ